MEFHDVVRTRRMVRAFAPTPLPRCIGVNMPALAQFPVPYPGDMTR